MSYLLQSISIPDKYFGFMFPALHILINIKYFSCVEVIDIMKIQFTLVKTPNLNIQICHMFLKELKQCKM